LIDTRQQLSVSEYSFLDNSIAFFTHPEKRDFVALSVFYMTVECVQGDITLRAHEPLHAWRRFLPLQGFAPRRDPIEVTGLLVPNAAGFSIERAYNASKSGVWVRARVAAEG
jgi:hypothetical protein